MTPNYKNAVPIEMLHTLLNTLQIDISKFMFDLSCDDTQTIDLYIKLETIYRLSKQFS